MPQSVHTLVIEEVAAERANQHPAHSSPLYGNRLALPIASSCQTADAAYKTRGNMRDRFECVARAYG